MFTGLIEGLATLVAVQADGPARALTLRPDCSLPDLVAARIGDSVALNGCCLTIVSSCDGEWTFQAGSETLLRTNLGELELGDPINLERSLRVGDRLGGHFVQGHIDGTARVSGIFREGEWTNMEFTVSPSLTRQMVSKGSVAVDGVSLTLVNVDEGKFSVALIPHTLAVTTLGRRKEGDTVNIETDVIGKYLEKMLAGTPVSADPSVGEGQSR